ncbi:MAG: type IV pilus twitching motility protein PilT [Deltaproteobacteria bacterium]|nr:type IV pilus twitching motility protein PilT [Deltaproteobacteria bacterium]
MDINEICKAAVRFRASDIHLKVGLPPMIRVHGELQPVSAAEELSAEAIGRMAWEMMTEGQRARFKADNDLDMSHEIPGLGRFRVNVFRQRKSIGMVLRAIPSQVRTLDELQLPPILKDIAGYPRGMVLVTGTTGSGKSTTLAAMIEEINRSYAHHVITIEDPIEFTFRDRRSVINQREVGVDSRSFSTALRAALRQDPDAVLVGELRDRETMEIALQAAETGHLVLSTLHTLDAAETINRVIGFFEPHHQQQVRMQLASTLRAVLSQRLLPMKSGGRVAAVEVMINTGSVSECITDPRRTREISDHIAQGSRIYGTQTFDQSVFRLLKAGIVEERDALRSVNNPDELALRLRGISDEDWA